MKFNAVDIFSGCGGMSCGLRKAGFKLKAAVEIDDRAAYTYLNYPPFAYVNMLNGIDGDICKLKGEDILKAAGIHKDEIYLLAGGPPCQVFSQQNPKNITKPIDERKKLLFEFLRIIEEAEPPFILMENVPGIKSSANKDILDEFISRLRKKYFVVEGILNSADYGVPQLRKRFILQAVRLDINKKLIKRGFIFDLPKPTHSDKPSSNLLPWRTVRDAIGDLPKIEAGEDYEDEVIHNHKCAKLSDTNFRRIRAIRANGGSRNGLPEELVLKCHKEGFEGHTDVYGIMDADKPAPTITGGCLSYSKGRFGHYEQDRGLSIREAARLQTFPDDFVFDNSLKESALQIGNAMPIELAKACGMVFNKAMAIAREQYWYLR